MATVESIVDALNTQFLTLTEVDFVSADNFMPAIESASVSALTLPFLQTDSATVISHRTQIEYIHRIRTEFWIKHISGSEVTTMQLARDLGVLAVNKLVENNGTGYTIHKGSTFEYSVDAGFIRNTSFPWLIAVLISPIQNLECP